MFTIRSLRTMLSVESTGWLSRHIYGISQVCLWECSISDKLKNFHNTSSVEYQEVSDKLCSHHSHHLTSFPGSSPASDPSLFSYWEVVRGGGQADGPDVLVERDALVQFHESDIVIIGLRVVALVNDDPLHALLHGPLAGLTLLVKTQKSLPLVSLREST